MYAGHNIAILTMYFYYLPKEYHMAHQDTLTQLKPKFTAVEQWQKFLSFIDSQKVRGDAQELWLQWEIHLLKCQSVKTQWHSQGDRYVRTNVTTRKTLFQ
jgi:hypothetical protein